MDGRKERKKGIWAGTSTHGRNVKMVTKFGGLRSLIASTAVPGHCLILCVAKLRGDFAFMRCPSSKLYKYILDLELISLRTGLG
jgi:hypothetical protein